MTFESLFKKAFFIFISFVVIKANAEESNIAVLMYHRIGDDRYPSTNISQELFEKHIEYLVEENINVLPITELSKYLKKEISLNYPGPIPCCREFRKYVVTRSNM